MDKLISANSLYKKLSTNSKGERIPEYDVDNFPVTLTLSEIKKIIMDEPAAFDKEKVIAELVDLRQKEYCDDDCEDELLDGEKMYDEGCSQGVFEAYHKAIKVVEKGGVDRFYTGL